MEVFGYLTSCLAIVVLSYAWKSLNWAYLRPKKLERILREQGFKGNSYRFIYGDLKEMSETIQEATSKPINLGDDIKPRVLAFVFKTVQKYGNESFFWIGPMPAIIITEVELIKEVLAKHPVYPKEKHLNPLTKLFAQGLVTGELRET